MTVLLLMWCLLLSVLFLFVLLLFWLLMMSLWLLSFLLCPECHFSWRAMANGWVRKAKTAPVDAAPTLAAFTI